MKQESNEILIINGIQVNTDLLYAVENYLRRQQSTYPIKFFIPTNNPSSDLQNWITNQKDLKLKYIDKSDKYGGEHRLLLSEIVLLSNQDSVFVYEDYGRGNNVAVFVKGGKPVEFTFVPDSYGQLDKGNILVFKTTIGHANSVMVKPAYGQQGAV